jgi:hypothetical protein
MKPMSMLSSQQLSPPKLRFDYAIRTHVSDTPFDGFRRWGPYDKNQPRKVAIRCAVLYPTWAEQEMRKLREAFLRGMHFFKGFQRFSHGISVSCFDTIPLNTNENMPLFQQAQVYRDAIAVMGDTPEWDLVFALIPLSQRYVLDTPYYAVKILLSARGIPCQLLAIEKLRSDATFKWSLANIALQVYAKLGNVPWVVETSDRPADLIIGIGRRQIRRGRIGPTKRFTGFTTAYKNNGAFLTFQGIAGAGSDDDYCQQLALAVTAALVSYHTIQSQQGLPALAPDRVILHSFKKIGQEEIEAIEKGIRDGSQNHTLLPYALLHIDGSSNFLVFDTDHRTFLPPSGYSVGLGPLQALLLTEGRERYERRKIGFPSPLAVRLDTRSMLEGDDLATVFPSLLEQVYGLSKVNWRGFNAAAIPVTLSYSRLIANVISSCQDPELWARIVCADNLRNKAWFL